MIQNRRRTRRYPIRLNIRYEFAGRRTAWRGSGETLNMSTGGVLFVGNQPAPVGASVELALQWPVPEGANPLSLMARGRIVRCDGNKIAVFARSFWWRRSAAHREPAQVRKPG